MSVIGFDLGYQSCYIAVARQGGIETIANEYSDRLTPAFVSLGANCRSLGHDAKNQLSTNLKNTIFGWSKFIGRKFHDPSVQEELKYVPYDVVEGHNGMASFKVNYCGEQHIFLPQQVAGMMFTKLKTTAETELKTKVVDCVISVPCYFTDQERRALLEASDIAGLNCLRLMNDTTATALAYGIYKQDLPAQEEKPRNVVFVDMGHSDLQISACAFHKGKLKVLATATHPNLGGRVIDRYLADYFSVDFKTRYNVDAKTKPKAYIRLMSEVEKVKKLMSANQTKIPLNIECFMNDKDVTGSMCRPDMENIAANFFSDVETTMTSILQRANLKCEDIYSVEVVGGSTRIPKIKELVMKVFGKTASTTLNADEAVARGCALQCAILSPTLRVRDFSITDCQMYPINLSWQGGFEEEASSSELEVFPKLHQIPFSKMLTFYRKEPFELYAKYSDSDPYYPDDKLGHFSILNVVPQINGENSKVKVKVRVDKHGIFNVAGATLVEKIEQKEEIVDKKMDVENGTKANGEESQNQDPSSPAEEAMDVESQNQEAKEATKENEQPKENGEVNAEPEKKEEPKKNKVKTIDLPVESSVQLSQSTINGEFEIEAKMIAQDKLEKERLDAKNAVEEYIYSMRDQLFTSLENYVQETDRDAFSKVMEQAENWLYEDGEDEKKSVYVDKLAELKKFGEPILERYQEAQSRPQYLEDLSRSIMLITKAINSYHAKEELYNHIDLEEMKKVEKCVAEKCSWYDTNVQKLSILKPYENAHIKSSEIVQQRQSLENTCHPILNKPKPKPKEEPPKVEKSEDVKKEETNSVPEQENKSNETNKEGMEQD